MMVQRGNMYACSLNCVLQGVFVLLISSSQMQATSAEGCKDGLYGRNCAYKCSSNCINNRCITSKYGADKCVDGCIDGYSGDSCNYPCPPLCKTCQRYNNSHCLSCRDFFFGLSCGNSCKQKCPDTDCDPQGKCLPRDVCGAKCQDCNARDRICNSCENGFYGEKCDLRCSANCDCPHDEHDALETCLGYCEKTTGNCSHGCKKSFFGNVCQSRCSDHCREDICNVSTGVCVKGCKDGYFGHKCESGCNEHCKDALCDINSGQCVSGCAEGYYGVECTTECNIYCEHNICERGDGECSNGCKEGYYGRTCKAKCGEDCAVCQRYSGECIITLTTEATGNTTYKTGATIQPTATYTHLIVSGVAVILFISATIAIICLRRCSSNGRVLRNVGDNLTAINNPAMAASYITLNNYTEICEGYSDMAHNSPTRAILSSSYYLPMEHGSSAPIQASNERCNGTVTLARDADHKMGSISMSHVPTRKQVSRNKYHGKDTDDAVSELNMLMDQEDNEKGTRDVLETQECPDTFPTTELDRNAYLSAVSK